MKKQAAERDEKDRMSQLPQPILHHILSFLSQKEAIQTCVLSKSWRYIGSTRPKIELLEDCFNGNKQTFLSVLHNTLHCYYDQKLSIQQFLVEMSMVDSESISLLEKWIPIVISDLGVKTFNLSFRHLDSAYFDLPSIVFKAEPLQKLYLQGCKLSQINTTEKVLSKQLQTLCLQRVYIDEEAFDMILSSCTLIEYLALDFCEGLRTIKVINKLHNLKDFGFSFCEEYDYGDDDLSIEINAPTLETIRIVSCPNWYRHNNYLFPHLKSLCLYSVQLSTKPFENFSCNFPCLEYLKLQFCYGFEELNLSSRSIKRLTIVGLDKSIKVTIDATSILNFEFSFNCIFNNLPSSISFTATSGEWKSHIHLWCCVDSDHDILPWFLKLNQLLKALSQSQISLELFLHPLKNRHTEDIYGGFCKPVVVEHLRLRGYFSSSSFPGLLNCLFRTCRPRYIGMCLYTNAQTEWERENNRLAEFICKILLNKERDFWQQDLEELSMQVSDENGKEWHPVQGTSLLECALPEKQNIRFRLKWRELSKACSVN